MRTSFLGTAVAEQGLPVLPTAPRRNRLELFQEAAPLGNEAELAALCFELAGGAGRFSGAEEALLRQGGAQCSDRAAMDDLRAAVRRGEDPLGDAFTRLRSPAERRSSGAVYTPQAIVASMVAWLAEQGSPARIVDPGAGSGRFLLEAGRRFPAAELVAVEQDPLAALMLRANLKVLGWERRSQVVVGDYREWEPASIEGTTAFVGNPPYVRHHGISESWKAWYAARFGEYGIKASALAGLHSHFFLKTRLLAKEGDFGAFITSAEWLDVNYGEALRRLLAGEMGLASLHVLEPAVEAFPGTATTAAIACFRVGASEAPVRVRSVARTVGLNALSKGREVSRSQMRSSARWSVHLRTPARRTDEGVELGELFRVHRGQVTGANAVWIAGREAERLPERVKVATVTKARELIEAGACLRSDEGLRRVVDLPPDLGEFSGGERDAIETFLRWAAWQGADQTYIARHRKAWWSVGLRPPAPILCTYMARRPPQFTMNACGAGHINIAHGLYPRQPLPEPFLRRLVAWLNGNIGVGEGRTYAGGLTKFEPKEVERLRIPSPETLPG